MRGTYAPARLNASLPIFSGLFGAWLITPPNAAISIRGASNSKILTATAQTPGVVGLDGYLLPTTGLSIPYPSGANATYTLVGEALIPSLTAGNPLFYAAQGSGAIGPSYSQQMSSTQARIVLANTNASSNFNVPINQRFFWAYTQYYVSSTCNAVVYINNVQVGSATFTNNVGVGTISLGQVSGMSAGSVFIWSRQLSVAELSQVFYEQSNGYPSFVQRSGTPVIFLMGSSSSIKSRRTLSPRVGSRGGY